jgi:2-oxoglutarate ferredoxin oxidoreductase subunit alpha
VVAEANTLAFKAGYHFGETAELFESTYEIKPAALLPGTYTNVTGNTALAWGLIAASELAKLPVFLGSYPITPASDILHELSRHKNFGVRTLQAEDEIAGVNAALGAAFAGHLGVTTTSGPGIDLKSETIGLAVSVELPLLIIDIQRGGPSTGLPTKTEQADLLQAIFGRNSEAPIPVLAAASPADAFEAAIEAVRIAVTYMTPVILLSDGYIANGAEPWRLPRIEDLKPFPKQFLAQVPEGGFLPYARDSHLARPWVKPGTPGLEHRVGGLEKAHLTGHINYEPENHEFMVRMRNSKVMGVRETIPTPNVFGDSTGEILIVGWGSTQGAITSAVEKLHGKLHAKRRAVSSLHLRHVWPLPKGLDKIFGCFRSILVPEMNMGQMARVLRSEYPEHNIISYPKVQGLPFRTTELVAKVESLLEK